jgi:heme-degrading monooxygenase HmoA
MIARIWRGWTSADDASAYIEYLQQTGIAAYRGTPGNRGAWILHRRVGDRTEFITLSFWDSLDAVRRFAGPDVDEAVFYPEDDRFLVDREERVQHLEIEEGRPQSH